MKKIYIFIILVFLIAGCSSKNNLELEYANKIDLKLTSEKGLIEIQLDQDEAKEFIDKINNLKVEKIANRDIKGWSLYARGFDENNQELYRISFIGYQINVDDEWYQTNQDSIEKITEIYK